MKTQKNLEIASSQPIDFIDITESVRAFVRSSNAGDGLLTVASLHTTLGLVLNERCEELQKDMIDFLRRLAPPEIRYRHNQVAPDGRPNAHSHLISLLLPSQLTIVVSGGRLSLGEWQSIFAVELDGPRPVRKIHLTLF